LRFDDRPFLWMISPTLSHRMQQRCCLHPHPDWGEGIYFRPESDRSAVVVVHQLPVTHVTLWLRLLGRGKVQKQAVAELMALPPDYPYRNISLRHIAVLQKNLKARQNLDNDLEDVIMALSITYEQIEAEILQKGREEGRKEALSITYEQIETEILQKGREEGREEGGTQEKLSIARNMLNEGIEPEMIFRLTGLPQDQLDILVKEIKP
jgi:predicted transposase/invertase (TIGR01784 family)